jgi:hypothetical protein
MVLSSPFECDYFEANNKYINLYLLRTIVISTNIIIWVVLYCFISKCGFPLLIR